MKIAVDAMGGDFAPKAVVEGAILAANELPEHIKIVLIGQEELILPLLQEGTYPSGSIEVVHAPEVIDMDEHPTKALTQKPNSSIVYGFTLLKEKKVDAFCSAGNTGAMMVGVFYTIKAIEGVLRPTISTVIPKVQGGYGLILDVGLQADCKPENLLQNAILGSIYAQTILEIENPSVALINIGEEEGKGNLLITFPPKSV